MNAFPLGEGARAPWSLTRPARRALLAVFCFPPAWLAAFVVLVVRARLALGHWPRSLHVSVADGRILVEHALDPKTFGLHYESLLLGCPCVVFAFVLAPFAPALLGRASAPLERRGTVVYLVACAAILVLWTLDPGGYWDWFRD